MNNPLSVIPVEDVGLFQYADVSIIRVDGTEYVPDVEPDLLDQTMVWLNDLMRGRDTMRLAELRDLDDPSHRSSGHLPSDIVLMGIFATWYGEHPDRRGPYGLLFEWPESPHLPSTVVWHEHVFERDEDGRLILWADEGDQ